MVSALNDGAGIAISIAFLNTEAPEQKHHKQTVSNRFLANNDR